VDLVPGVIGPARIAYERAILIVDVTAKIVEAALISGQFRQAPDSDAPFRCQDKAPESSQSRRKQLLKHRHQSRRGKPSLPDHLRSRGRDRETLHHYPTIPTPIMDHSLLLKELGHSPYVSMPRIIRVPAALKQVLHQTNQLINVKPAESCVSFA